MTNPNLRTARYFEGKYGNTLRDEVSIPEEKRAILQCRHCNRDFATIRIWKYASSFCSVDCCYGFQESMGGPYNWHESPPPDWKELAAGESDDKV